MRRFRKAPNRTQAKADPVTPALRGCAVCAKPVTLGAKTCQRHNHALARQSRERPCAACGKAFSPYPSAMRRSAAKFCSWACYRTSVAPRPAMVAVKCVQCGGEFRRTNAAVIRVRHAYCSRKCLSESQVRPASPELNGQILNRGARWRSVAAVVRERDGYRCRRCGKGESEEGQRLSVDHVLPWRSFTSEVEANDPSNLVALCRSCHARKTRAEARWLKGDVLDMERYRESVAQPWCERHPEDAPDVGVPSKVLRAQLREYLASMPVQVREHMHVDPQPGCVTCFEVFP